MPWASTRGRCHKKPHWRIVVIWLPHPPLPVSADLEKGFGDSPQSCAQTIQAAAATRLAGGSIEDHTGEKSDPIYSFDLAVARIGAACVARDALKTDFVLTARCENFLWERPDLSDTIRRLQAFEAAGADVLYALGLHDLETIKTVCRNVIKPVNVVMGMPGAVFDLTQLAEAGVKRVSVGSALPCLISAGASGTGASGAGRVCHRRAGNDRRWQLSLWGSGLGICQN